MLAFRRPFLEHDERGCAERVISLSSNPYFRNIFKTVGTVDREAHENHIGVRI